MSQKKLKIAMIAPPWLSMYPGCYYGIENVVHYLTSALHKQGHHVELFTVSGTTTPASKRYWFHEEDQYRHIHLPLHEGASIVISHILYALNIIRKAGDFDIIHDHNSYLGPAIMAYADNLPPVLHTLHGPFTDERLKNGRIPDNRLMFSQFRSIKHLYFNSISKAQFQSAPRALRSRIKAVIYNGIDPDDYPLAAKKDSYFLNVGSLEPNKGQAVAAKLSAQLGVRLKLAGTIAAGITTPRQLKREENNPLTTYRHDPHFKYFNNEIRPYLIPGQIEYVGAVFGERKYQIFARAKAFLAPVTWEEPFGIAIIDALASGTPVIAFRRGALPEIIQHGVNGFLADNEREFKNYMKRVGEIDPMMCRKTVEKRFSDEIMTNNYLRLYRSIISQVRNR